MTTELFVDDRGAGSPVLLIHSSGMSSRQWRALGDMLASSHRVLAPDLIGVGNNPPWPPDEPFQFQADADALGRIVMRLDEPVHVVGHSYGGLLAVMLARTVPEMIRSVAAYDAVAFGVLYNPRDEGGLSDLDRARQDPIFFDASRGGTDPWMEAFVDFWNGPGAWRALPEHTRNAFLRVGRKVYFEVSSLMTDRTPSTAYGVFEGPALMLTGSTSPASARHVAERLAAAFPHGRLETIAQAGHMGPLTHTREVNAAIAAHIRSA